MGGYRLFVNADRTVLVRLWPPRENAPEEDGHVELCTRGDAGQTWGPPIVLEEEVVPD